MSDRRTCCARRGWPLPVALAALLLGVQLLHGQELRSSADPLAVEYRRIAADAGGVADADRFRDFMVTFGRAGPGQFLPEAVTGPRGEQATFYPLEPPARVERWEAALVALTSIDRDRLPPRDALTYDVTRATATRELMLATAPPGPVPPAHWRHQVAWFYESELLRPTSVAEYEALLAELRGVVHEVDDVMERLRSGLLPPAILMAAVPAEIRALLVDEPIGSVYLARFRDFPVDIPPAEQARLRASAEAVYVTAIRPAYERLLAFVLEVSGTEDVGLAALPGGLERYETIIRSWAGSVATAAEVHRRAREEMDRYALALDSIRVATGFEESRREFLEFLRTDDRFTFEDSAAYVRAARDIAKRIDGAIFRAFRTLPRLPYDIEVVRQPRVADYVAGSLEHGRPGRVRLFVADDRPGRTWHLPSIVLHEGTPGHHFAYAIALEREVPGPQQQGMHRAFTEGWAVYAEGLGRELGIYEGPYAGVAERIGGLSRAASAIIDTGIHAYGWSAEQAEEYLLDHVPLTRPLLQSRVRRIIANPGVALLSKIGEWTFLDLRVHAERELGKSFDVRAFHDALLENGELPLDVLREHMRRWVAAQALLTADTPGPDREDT